MMFTACSVYFAVQTKSGCSLNDATAFARLLVPSVPGMPSQAFFFFLSLGDESGADAIVSLTDLLLVDAEEVPRSGRLGKSRPELIDNDLCISRLLNCVATILSECEMLLLREY